MTVRWFKKKSFTKRGQGTLEYILIIALIVIVLFQDDLRRALTHVGKNPFFSAASAEEEREMVDEQRSGRTERG